MPVIAVINESDDVRDADLAVWVNAIQRQLVEDVAPFWPEAAEANLLAVPKGSPAPQGTWQIVLLPDADRGEDLGYHEATPSSLPLGKVFTRTTTQFRQTLSRVLSHEIIEMVVDPFITRTSVIGGNTYLVEACDPVHLDNLGYEKSGVLVSNFVTPAYYGFTAGDRYDMGALLNGPCPTLTSGGAVALFVGNTLELRVAADSSPEQTAALQIHDGSRRHRRRKGHHDWRNSRPRPAHTA